MLYEFLAEGFEEMEAVAPIDIIRRAGIEIATVGVGGRLVSGSHGIKIEADLTESQLYPYKELEGIILPGGMPGTLNLDKSPTVEAALEFAVKNNLLVAAICAAPTVPGKRGYLKGREATCYPEKPLKAQLDGAILSEKAVCVDGNFITSRGAGTATEFALAIVKYFKGEQAAKTIAEAIIKCPM